MALLIVGLILFLGVHSVRIFADSWRADFIARHGLNTWKVLYSVASLVGFVLLVWGLGIARQNPIPLWYPPEWLRHLAIAINLIAFILLAAYFLPAGKLKARLGHPMILAVKTWAFAHILANGTLADLLLFGGFLLWAIADFAVSRRRDRAAGTVRIAGPARNDAFAVIVGIVLWAAILWRLHLWVIGVSPLA
jgi:uncharacterized membrane protein